MIGFFASRPGRHASLSLGLILALLLGLLAGSVQAQMGGGEPKLQAKAVWNNDLARPGGQNVIAVVLDIAPNWHISADEAQAIESDFKPYPTTISAKTDTPGVTFGKTQFPVAHALPVGGMPDPIAVFDGQTVVYIPVVVAADAEPGDVPVEVTVDYQACDDLTCDFPTIATVQLTLRVVAKDSAETGVQGDPALFEGFDPSVFSAQLPSDRAEPDAVVTIPDVPDETAEAKGIDFYFFEVDPSGPAGFALVLILAAAGGALLNFTPCVLPVIPIKILGLAQTAGNRRKTLILGAIMSAGVVAFWLVLGVAIAMVSGFTASNQLFQYPAFSIGLGIVIAVLAVGMCGLFAVQLPNWVYAINPKHDSAVGSFGFGIMTAVLSTPCTAPFMGGAAGWAATQDNPGVVLSIFTAIGAGMALPYLVLSANPKLVDRLPRTGPGSELLKQVMGILMLAAASFFVGAGVSGLLSDGTEAAPKGHWWVVAGFVAAAGVWLAIRVPRATASPGKRGVFVAMGLATVVAAGVGAMSMTKQSDGEDAIINWVYYTPERFEQALAEGNVVLLDFTADWCANCHVLEHNVLNSDAVAGALRESGFVAMKVDLTGGYPDGKLKLNETGAVMIPWLVIYAPDGSVVFKADWYTANQIVDALEQAGTPTEALASGTSP